MMLTEEQAGDRWCPKALAVSQTVSQAYPAGINRGRTIYPCNCVASGCMMWRWSKIPANYRSSTPRDGWEHLTDADELAEYDTSEPFWLEPDAERNKRRVGWCGLAGRVEYA